MICLLALIVFGILAIFSARFRPLFKEALACVFRRITFRKCETGLDKRLKAQITGKLMTKKPTLAKLLYKNFELLSWFFILLLFATFGYSLYSGYNYITYGNCNGPGSQGFCLYGAFSDDSTNIKPQYQGEKIFPTIDDDPKIGPEDAPVTIIEFGCYLCPYTKKAESTVQKLLEIYKDKILYVYRDFPISEKHAQADLHAQAANCANEQNKFWEYRQKLFELQTICLASEEVFDHTPLLKQYAQELGLNQTQFDQCIDSNKYKDEVLKDFMDGQKAHITGTPTVFINNKTIIGPKPIAAFKKIINNELKVHYYR